MDRETPGQSARHVIDPPTVAASTVDVSILALEAWGLISTRARNCLGHRYTEDDPASTIAGVSIDDMRLSHLACLRPADILRVPNLGLSSYFEIALAMNRYGWRFHSSWNGGLPLAYFTASASARHVAQVERAAKKHEAILARGEIMRRLRDEDRLTLQEIGDRFDMSKAAADVAIRQVRRIHDLRARHPLPKPPAQRNAPEPAPASPMER